MVGHCPLQLKRASPTFPQGKAIPNMPPKPSAGSSGVAGKRFPWPCTCSWGGGRPRANSGSPHTQKPHWVMPEGWTHRLLTNPICRGQTRQHPTLGALLQQTGCSRQAEKGAVLSGGAICSSPDPLFPFPVHHCWAMPYTGAQIVLPQRPDEL